MKDERPHLEVGIRTGVNIQNYASLLHALYFLVPPNPNSTLGKVDVCATATEDLTDLCSTVLRLPQFEDYSLIAHGEVEDCKDYDVVVLYRFYISLFITVNARKCPTKPPLFVTNGHGNVSIFVLGYITDGLEQLELLFFL